MILLRIHSSPQCKTKTQQTSRLCKLALAAALRATLCLASPISAAALPLNQPLDNVANGCDAESYVYLRVNLLAEELGDSSILLSDALESIREQLMDCLETSEAAFAPQSLTTSREIIP